MTAKKTTPKKTTPKKASAKKATAKKAAAPQTDPPRIRVRMYRVGFGDFFLLTVPGTKGPAHILIDCGVHQKPVKDGIHAGFEDLKATTGKHLDLVIATHYHLDHLSGFATFFDEFLTFTVGAVWITNRLEHPDDPNGLLTRLRKVATAITLQADARSDRDKASCKHKDAVAKAHNALGIAEDEDEDEDDVPGADQLLAAGGAAPKPHAPREGRNAKALRLLAGGFGGQAKVEYYQAGDTPHLPPALRGVLKAEILGPAPVDSDGTFSADENTDKEAQYLAAVAATGIVPNGDKVEPFDQPWRADAADYPWRSFLEFHEGFAEPTAEVPRPGEQEMLQALADLQPDALLAAADKVDGTLNNQSLVVLFTCHGKKLLFVGDAQWGNWASWLYGEPAAGKPPPLTPRALDVLSSLDFYKVGHHGSTNANPVAVVKALTGQTAAMCSTAVGAYGCEANDSEVPRIPLMDALDTYTAHRTVRSDRAGNTEVKPSKEALRETPKLPAGFSTVENALYIDYVIDL